MDDKIKLLQEELAILEKATDILLYSYKKCKNIAVKPEYSMKSLIILRRSQADSPAFLISLSKKYSDCLMLLISKKMVLYGTESIAQRKGGLSIRQVFS